MVVFDYHDYINKAESLLQQWDTYRTLNMEPVKNKNILINLLKSIKV